MKGFHRADHNYTLKYFTEEACLKGISLNNKLSVLPWVRWQDPITIQVDLSTQLQFASNKPDKKLSKLRALCN